jgi:aldose 1-epimerase
MTNIENITFMNSKCQKISLQNQFLKVQILTFGAYLYRLESADKNGHFDNIAICPDFEQMHNNPFYFGAAIGPVAGRIAGPIKDKFHFQDACVLHSGEFGFHNQLWQVVDCGDGFVKLFLNDNHHFGDLQVFITYQLEKNALKMTTTATATTDTIFNPTSHVYFNLNGGQKLGSIDNHFLTLPSSQIMQTDANLIPNGDLLPVAGSSYDFQNRTALSQNLNLDTPFILDKPCVVLENELRRLTVTGNANAIVVFTLGSYKANLQDTIGGKQIHAHNAIALEMQYQPNLQENDPNFALIQLKAGQTKENWIKWEISRGDY